MFIINLIKREKTALKPTMGANARRELSWQIQVLVTYLKEESH